MTPEAQRIAIAKANGRAGGGWYCQHCHCDVQDDHVTFGETHDVRAGGCGESVSGYGLPDYLNDRNTMCEAIAKKCNNSVDGPEFGRHLVKIIFGSDFWTMPTKHQVLNHWELMRLATADASQLAEAFLKTLNLWTDEQ